MSTRVILPTYARGDRAALVALGLLSVGLQLPFLARGISRLDEGSILTIAQALGEGSVLYRDHATFVGPVIYELMALLLEHGGGLLVGRLLQALVLGPLMSRLYNKHVRIVTLKPNKDLAYMNELFEAGKLAPVIDGPYKLADVPEAFRLFGTGDHHGKIIITMT